MAVDLSPLDDLADDLAALDSITSAGTDPSGLRTPLVWVRLTGVDLGETYADGYIINAILYLAVGDQDPDRARVRLFGMLDDALTVPYVLPAGQVTLIRYVPQDGANALPALSVPVSILCTQE